MTLAEEKMMSIDDYCNKKKTCLFLHLEAKYAKMNYKNEIYAKNQEGVPRLQKVNLGKKSTVKPGQS